MQLGYDVIVHANYFSEAFEGVGTGWFLERNSPVFEESAKESLTPLKMSIDHRVRGNPPGGQTTKPSVVHGVPLLKSNTNNRKSVATHQWDTVGFDETEHICTYENLNPIFDSGNVL